MEAPAGRQGSEAFRAVGGGGVVAQKPHAREAYSPEVR